MNVKRACWFRLSIKRTTPEPTNSRKLTYLNPPKPTLLGFLIATYFLIHVLKLPFARKSRCTKACTYIASTYICIYMYYVYYIYNMYIYMHVCVCVFVCARVRLHTHIVHVYNTWIVDHLSLPEVYRSAQFAVFEAAVLKSRTWCRLNTGALIIRVGSLYRGL